MTFVLSVPSRFGYLRSPIPADASIAAQADIQAELLDRLGIKKIPVVGISAGGPSSLKFALRHPDRCSALVMACAVSHRQTESLAQRIAFNTMFRSDFVFWLITTTFRSNLTALFGVSKEVQEKMTTAEQDWLSEFVKLMHPITLRKAGIAVDRAQIFAELPAGQDERLKNIAAPTLVIHCMDDALVSYTHAQHTAKLIPNARLITFDSGGHLMFGHHEDAKLAVSRFVKEFV